MLYTSILDSKNNSDQTYSCPRDLRLSASWLPIEDPPETSRTVTHSTIVLRGLRGPFNLSLIMPRDIFFLLQSLDC